ncbi:MAG TPA: trypsin-like serine protease [Polyangiaceae bacterium]|jgi:hypothetical protein
MNPRSFVRALLFACFGAACSGGIGASPAPSSAPTFLQATPLAGIPDRGDDPAVVAIDAGGPAVCTGTLIAPDAVLTSRRCVSVTSLASSCPDGGPAVVAMLAPESLRVLAGDTATGVEERARGRQVVIEDDAVACGDDVAVLLLDTPIDDIQPLAVRPTGAAQGDALRTVEYATIAGGSAPVRLVRDNALVTDVSPASLTVAEACAKGGGGPAIDEASVEVVAVASLPAGCGAAAAELYTRADVVLPFVADTLARDALEPATSTGQEKTKKGDIDVGAACVRAEDCAAGVCVTDGQREYCSRTCDAHDRCPTHWRCQRSMEGPWICTG